jgi:hypothetical protein
MLTGNDKPVSPAAGWFEKALLRKTRFAWFEHLFLRFGAGSHLLDPITQSKYWNTFCWTVIAFGIAGWMVLFWILPPFSE